jgi:pantothenate synthetase
MSSRNTRLDGEARGQARALVQALEAAEKAMEEGELKRDDLLARVKAILGAPSLAEIDYAELRDPVTLALAPEMLSGPTLLALAVVFRRADGDPKGTVRLIDNRVLTPR